MHRVKELRELRGLSVRALALATGFSHTTIARLEKGERKLSTPQAVALSSYFGVSVDYLLGKSPEEMFNGFVDSLRGDWMTETRHNDGDVTQSLSPDVSEPTRTKIEILLRLRDINSKAALDTIFELVRISSAQDDFS
ncbi:MAG TPA: hypothetical protein DD415_06275 [Clostridiales bacterium]|nr:hypothetical protein [Clostridiales bacterium]